MSNRILRVTGLIAALLIAFCATIFGQDAPPVPPNTVVQGTTVLIQLTDRLDTHTVGKAPPATHGHAATSS